MPGNLLAQLLQTGEAVIIVSPVAAPDVQGVVDEPQLVIVRDAENVPQGIASRPAGVAVVLIDRFLVETPEPLHGGIIGEDGLLVASLEREQEVGHIVDFLAQVFQVTYIHQHVCLLLFK